jgi:PhnB protein
VKLNPYLAFDGRCREAFEFYEKTLGGTIVFIQTMGESPMASDAPPGQFTRPAGFCVAVHYDDPDEGRRVFDRLSENANVQMPYQPTFFAKGFGMLIDQFGTPWIVNAGQLVGS